ncbi:formylglycine-generating enzyme family protein [Novosphingobium sp. BW1]|nr:formylglycine-generating enzyme family protein [Novosphingobium sp. BW1]
METSHPCALVAGFNFELNRHHSLQAEIQAGATSTRMLAATGNVTFAEITPAPADYPGALPELLYPASLVFEPPRWPVSLHDISQWWDYRRDANGKQPLGKGFELAGLEDHPVVHIACKDARAYANWAGKDPPTEAEREFASGDELLPGGIAQANTWQRAFPNENTPLDGYLRTSPVRTYPANPHGIYDLIGNVWEWTGDFYSQSHQEHTEKEGCCAPRNPLGDPQEKSYDPAMSGIGIARKVLKGGSHVCSPNYRCHYRPAARHAQPIGTSTSHVGFRCVVRGASAIVNNTNLH